MTNDLTPRRSNSTASASSSSASLFGEQPPRSHSPDAVDASRSKVVGACSKCRVCKVKCENDGTAPCKRCKKGGYECTFKPREVASAVLHDEWRTKTDETLNKLVSAINALVQQEDAVAPTRKRKATDTEWENGAGLASAGMTPGLSQGGGFARANVPRSGGNGGSYQPSPARAHLVLGGEASGATSYACSYAGVMSRRSSLAPGLDHTLDLSDRTGLLQIQSHTRTTAESSQPTRISLPLPRRLGRAGEVRARAPPKPALVACISRYRFPDPSLGSNDPRLDAIRLGLLSSHEARSLFSLYAKTIEPYGFGFPDFPASSDLTPVLLSAITAISSLHASSADLRVRQVQLRTDVLNRTLPYAPSTAEDEFNPESGIGTEEVVGACIWSSYDGSEDAWRVARAARWWSEKYSYETGPHAGLTVGEMVAILPPVRHVNMQDRVRVWLTAFVAELHQCEIHAKEPIMECVDPAQYGQSLEDDRMTKQDAGLLLFARIAFLVVQSRSKRAEELVGVTKEVTASWCATRALLGTEPDRKDTYDHMIDLHHALARATLLVRACRLYEEQCAEGVSHQDIGLATAALVSCSQTCHSACIDSIRLLLTPSAGLMGSLASLPSIYHFWIAGCLVFLLELCSPDRMHCQLGLLVEGQLEDTLRTVGNFMQNYLAELSACSTTILVEPQQDSDATCEVIKHPATDAALAIADMLASVQATA